ncbi:MAG TPA: serine protease [Candidatus Acidoferrum sp.]|nr:serine protease [Candidatus Acidoferrum sp.]
MHCKSHLRTLAAAGALAALAIPAPADDLAQKGREIFNQHQHAVVTVQEVLKVSSAGNSASAESKQDITGTVLDPSGLTLLSLSACDPTEMYQRMLGEEYSRRHVETEISDMKILLDDGTEVPAEIVLRDKDLDLAFIRPKTKPASPMAAIDLTKTSPAQVLDQVITLNRLNSAAGRAYAASVERISAVIQKPRTFYIPDSTMTSTALGSPAFAADGKLVGVVVMRTISSRGGSARNPRDNMASIILPAEDIAKAAKQAPEVKADAEKKEPAKESNEAK